MPKIVILCGLSPLPVCQALKTLEATEVVIIHGKKGSEKVAKRVRDYCRDTLKITESKVQLVEVAELVPLECLETMSGIRPLLASSALVYGPGTSVMNAMIHEVWRSADGNGSDKGQTWYVQANPSQLLPSNSNLLGKNGDGNVLNRDKKKDVVPTGLDSRGLIKLDIDDGYRVVLGKNLDPFATWEDDVTNKIEKKEDRIKKAKAEIGQGVKEILYNGTGFAKDLSDDGKKWLRNFDKSFQNGFFMEAVIFQVLKEAFEPDQVFHSVKAIDRNRGKVLEMDVLLRKGDNQLWISSHTNSANNKWNKDKDEMTTKNPDTECRKKFFEAKENAVRLSGKEARSITIVNRSIQSIPRDEFHAEPYKFEDRIKNGKMLRRRLGVLRLENGGEKEYTIADRHIIVDLAELLGRNPIETMSDAKKSLPKSATTNLFKWIDNALNH